MLVQWVGEAVFGVVGWVERRFCGLLPLLTLWLESGTGVVGCGGEGSSGRPGRRERWPREWAAQGGGGGVSHRVFLNLILDPTLIHLKSNHLKKSILFALT